MQEAKKIKKELQKLADPIQASILQIFFKTGKGEYGEGDIFLGIKVPVQRKVAKKYIELPLENIKELLKSKIHEHRLTALIILTEKYKKSKTEDSSASSPRPAIGSEAQARRELGTKAGQEEKIFNLYLCNTKYINNWDLVDVTAPHIVGNFLLDKPRGILYKLAKSSSLWERRIAIIATLAFIRKEDFIDTLLISKILLKDKHDLIHKAVGWMLREVGKRDQKIEEDFLNKYYLHMPRVMLRYAIERLPEHKRKYYLTKN